MNKLQIIIHRINSIELLNTIPPDYGVEVDVRAHQKDLILNHEPFMDGENLEEYLSHYKHSFVIFNIKEAGIEHRVMELAEKFRIKDYFLLDVEFPYLYRAARSGVRNIAIRYSEDESIETVLKYKGLVDWVWIDTMTSLPLDSAVKQKLEGFKTCLVCPERWGRPEEICSYIEKLRAMKFPLDAVMTSRNYIDTWKHFAS